MGSDIRWEYVYKMCTRNNQYTPMSSFSETAIIIEIAHLEMLSCMVTPFYDEAMIKHRRGVRAPRR